MTLWLLQKGLVVGQARKKYTQQYKDEAVGLVVESGRPIAEVARDLGVHEGTLGNWVNRAKRSGKVKDQPLTSEDREELRRLQEENRRLKMERDFLKKQPRGLRARTSEIRVHCRHGRRECSQTTRRTIPGVFHV
ncbi:transposase [Flexivirga caeni]|uniref:transposase n=1 Tax=Flexivirga caeni TaxID=2294115 RepID=UPI001C65BA91